jgi:hypothetical protein
MDKIRHIYNSALYTLVAVSFFLTMLCLLISLKLKCTLHPLILPVVSHFNKSGIWPSGLIVCASLHEQNVIFYANIIMAHLNRPYKWG